MKAIIQQILQDQKKICRSCKLVLKLEEAFKEKEKNGTSN